MFNGFLPEAKITIPAILVSMFLLSACSAPGWQPWANQPAGTVVPIFTPVATGTVTTTPAPAPTGTATVTPTRTSTPVAQAPAATTVPQATPTVTSTATSTVAPSPTATATLASTSTPTTTATSTRIPTVTAGPVFPMPTQAPANSQASCKLDKIGTWSEIYDRQGNYQGPQRIEIGGGGVQHFDFYPEPSVHAVSFIVPKMEPIIGYGHGSAWEGNGPECENFDWVADTTRYARDRATTDPNSASPVQRRENGHSGLVFDLRNNGALVANVRNLSNEQIAALVIKHLEALTVFPKKVMDRHTPAGTSPSMASGPTATPSASATPAPAGGQSSCKPHITRVDPKQGVFLKLGDPDQFVVADMWSNLRSTGQESRRIFLEPGNNRQFEQTGGTIRLYAKNCQSQAESDYNVLDFPDDPQSMRKR